VLIDMDEETSLLYPSFGECIMPESKCMIMIIHNPSRHFCISQKNKMLESFSSNYFAIYLSFNNCFCPNLDIIKSSLDKAWYNDYMIRAFVPIQAIIGDRG